MNVLSSRTFESPIQGAEEVGRRLSKLFGNRKQQDIAAQLEVAPKTIGRWVSGKTLPDGPSLLALARAYRVDPFWLLTGQHLNDRKAKAPTVAAEVTTGYRVQPVSLDTALIGAPGSGGATSPVPQRQSELGGALAAQDTGALRFSVTVDGVLREYRVIPKIEDRVCAGMDLAGRDIPGSSSRQDGPALRINRGGQIALDREFMRATFGGDGDDYMTVTIEGDSMAPTLVGGDFIVIDRAVQRINVSGIYVLRFDGELTVKRVIRRSDGSIIVTSDNPAYARADEQFTRDAAMAINVVGRMAWPRAR